MAENNEFMVETGSGICINMIALLKSKNDPATYLKKTDIFIDLSKTGAGKTIIAVNIFFLKIKKNIY